MRFIGDRGYVVTFRQTDPLYTLDLADPARPRVTGELKILGYSAYLHPVGEHELLGVGQDATPEGIRLGTQVSLFDVSDPAAPRLLQRAGARRVDVLGRRVRPPRVPVVGAQAPRGRAGLRRESARPAQAIAFRVDRDAGIGVVGHDASSAPTCCARSSSAGASSRSPARGCTRTTSTRSPPGPFTAFESG